MSHIQASNSVYIKSNPDYEDMRPDHYMRVRILGSGSSGGVPRIGGKDGRGDWGICDPNEPKNRRSRCSVLVDQWTGQAAIPAPQARTTVLIDTSPDLREQLIAARTARLDAVIYTHDHADQSHGIDDLRAIAYRMKSQIPVYMDGFESNSLCERFKYCFNTPEGRTHPPILDLKPKIMPKDIITIKGAGGDIDFTALGLSHGPVPSLGFKFGPFTYTPDVWDIDPDVLDIIAGTQCWIVDALRYNPHPTHAHADKTLSWLAKVKPAHTLLTNLHIDMDYQTTNSELPGAQTCAYDGLEIFTSQS